MLNKPVVYLDHIYGFFLREKKLHCKYKEFKIHVLQFPQLKSFPNVQNVQHQ